MKKDIAYWVNLADYDIGTARAMLMSGRYLYVLFICQQAIEKILKALTVQETEKFPPKIHDLIKLANLANIEANDDLKEFLAKLSFYYIETRYPEQIINFTKDISRKNAVFYLSKSEEVFKWLKKKLH